MRRPQLLAFRFLARRLVMSIVAGVTLTVAIAWCCAVLQSPRSGVFAEGSAKVDGYTWTVRTWIVPGAVQVNSQRHYGTGSGNIAPDALLPSWAPYAEPAAAFAHGPYQSRLADARGWPTVTMWSETRRAFSTDPSLHGGLRLFEHTLPLMPIWPRFLLVAAAASCLALLVQPRLLPRFLRLWQYRCLFCGYPIGLSVRCTECGRPLTHQQAPGVPDARVDSRRIDTGERAGPRRHAVTMGRPSSARPAPRADRGTMRRD